MGKLTDVDLITKGGTQFVQTADGLKEVVVATAADLVNLPGLSEGVYLVGTGSTGAGEAFVGLGCFYGALMLTGALNTKVPHPNWKPDGMVEMSDAESEKHMIAKHNVDHVAALRTPQFYLLWTAVMGNAVAGMALISSAKTMVGEVFGVAMPAIVTAGFCTSYVAALSASNATGRIGWSMASDYLGRKNTYGLFALGIPLVLCTPILTDMVSTGGGGRLLTVGGLPGTLVLFSGGTMLLVSFYGGASIWF